MTLSESGGPSSFRLPGHYGGYPAFWTLSQVMSAVVIFVRRRRSAAPLKGFGCLHSQLEEAIWRFTIGGMCLLCCFRRSKIENLSEWFRFIDKIMTELEGYDFQ
jgi:hypothetical protein